MFDAFRIDLSKKLSTCNCCHKPILKNKRRILEIYPYSGHINKRFYHLSCFLKDLNRIRKEINNYKKDINLEIKELTLREI